MSVHTISDLYQMQSLPLSAKIRMTENRIRAWCDYWNDEVYVSFSGGKDSTVLVDIVTKLGYKDIPLVFVDTALEHLKMTGEVADKVFNKFRIITVNNWKDYQGNGRQVADKRQTSGSQVAADKEYKEIKEYKNRKIHNFTERERDFSELEQIALGDKATR
jgi:3'-phosphoadenosine 5'-phosphosulfate sulfotransferase (PAPS reductase)/FAD synthetase